MSLTDKVTNYLKQLPGFHTSRRIIVFESDDWGSIRMPSVEVYNRFVEKGFNMSDGVSARYNKYDSLATYEDLQDLFEVLSSVKDFKGNHCVMTPMCLVANPDFDKIEESGFKEYFYEPFTETLKKYPGCEKSFELWKEGISSGIFVPQFHGREHLNISRWLEALIAGDKNAHLAFKYKFWGYPKQFNSGKPEKSFQAAFDFSNYSEIKVLDKIIEDGLKIFSQLFGYDATCFTPPNGPLSRLNEKISAKNGIKYIQTARMIYNEPVGMGKTRKRIRYLGKRNKYNQVYLTRNCFFEPSECAKFNWVDKCLVDIDTAFKYNKPAIISSHRVNYIGALDSKNRDEGLNQLSLLLKRVIKIYPDIEFLTSSQLGESIIGNGFKET
ncbi:MAG: polysaccharide (de)acetylase [Bacteroidota bacterium]